MLTISELENAGVVFAAKLGKNKDGDTYAKIEVNSHNSITDEPLVAAVMKLDKSYHGLVTIGGHLIPGHKYVKNKIPIFGSRGFSDPKTIVMTSPTRLSLTHRPYDENMLTEVEGFSEWDNQLKALIDKHLVQEEAIRVARELRRRNTGLSEES